MFQMLHFPRESLHHRTGIITHHVTLTSVVVKSFDRLMWTHLKNIRDPLLDPLQFAYE